VLLVQFGCALQGHTQCVTEHEKYALGATKPGGYAAGGFAANGAAKPAQEGALLRRAVFDLAVKATVFRLAAQYQFLGSWRGR
jgi:hypothetical protein